MGNWKMTEYTVKKLNDDIENKKITVPKYQRGAVWNKQQKDKLIDSMNKGYPFGSILLYEKDNNRQIIDGLQRSTTIIEYVKNPAKFFTDENLNDEIMNEIIEKLNVVGNKNEMKLKLIDMIKQWVLNNHSTMQDIQRMQYGDLADEIIKEWPTALSEKDNIKTRIKGMFQEFQDICQNISNVPIPALVYEGDESLLPEIFERINSQGAKLTKHQIFSATWQDIVEIKDTQFYEILTNNRDRYENMLDESMELEEYNSIQFMRDKKVTIFELVFGFGKMISRKYPYLFNFDEKDKTKVESIGFNLINACLIQRSSNLKRLNINLKNYVGLDQIELFLTKVLSAIEYVDKRLGAGTKFKGNTRGNSKIRPLHSELQIVSIIATVFINRHANFQTNEKGDVLNLTFDISTNSNKWTEMKNTFDQNILKIYAMDILGQKWKGSGDKKLDNIIIENYYYDRVISWENFEQVLDVYYNTINSERNERKQVANPKEPEKLILNLIYAFIFRASDQNDDSNYDIEHLAPKALMKEKISRYREDFRLPISSIANLCLLPEYDNRTKRDNTLYQDIEYLNKIHDISKIEEKYSFTTKNDFEWLEKDLTEEQFKAAYLKFLDQRFKKMKEKIYTSLFVNNYRPMN